MQNNLAATKTNLLKTKRSLAFTEEGYELLDEKRKILLGELTAIVDSVDQHQAELDHALSQAYLSLDKALVGMGRMRLEELSFSIDIKSDISVSQRRIMGVAVPEIELGIRQNPPFYLPHEVSLYVDEAIAGFTAILRLCSQLSEKKIALLRIAAEAQKTIRKVNALEKVYIPYYRNTVKYISERLDEESRDAFAMLKIIKREKANQ